MAKATFEASTLPHLCDLLMAAAHADNHLDGREVEAVKNFLVGLIKDATELPEELSSRIEQFDPKTFELESTTKGLGELTREHKRAVLEMMSDLSESDDEIDLEEDAFLRTVGAAIGADAKDLEGLIVEIEIVAAKPRAVPPPPPPPKKA